MNKILSTLLIVLQCCIFVNTHAQSVRSRSNVFNTNSIAKKSILKASQSEFKKPMERAATLKYLAQKENSDFWNQNTLEWDSANYILYTYNSAGLPLTKTFYDVITGPVFRETSTYTVDNKISEIYNEEYINNSWKNFMKVSLNYAANGLVASETIQLWDSTSNGWINEQKQTYDYNANNDVELYTRQQFTNGNWTMVFGAQIDRVYINNNIAEELGIYYNPTTNSWDSTVRNTFNYGSHGFLTNFISETYNPNTLIWEYTFQEVYQFNSNNVVDTAINCIYNHDSNAWDSVQRIVDIEFYNFTGDPMESEFKKYTLQENFGSGFVNSYRTAITKPDNYGSTIEISEEFANNSWIPIDRFTRNYDDKYTYYELKYEEYLNGNYEVSDHVKRDITYDANDVIIEFIVNELDFFTRILTPSQRIRYSNFITVNIGIGRKKTDDRLSIFPNPAKSSANILVKLDEPGSINIEILDMQGKLIERIEGLNLLKGEHIFQTPKLMKGLYVVRMNDGKELSSTKIIIE